MRMRRTDRGAAAVEFALVVPMLLVVLFGLVDFGLAYNAKVTLTHAAREGARAVAMGETDASATTCATPVRGPRCRTEAAAVGLDISKLDVTFPASCTAPNNVTLVAEYEYSYVTPLADLLAVVPGGGGSSLGQSVTLTSTGVMRCGA